MKWKNSKENHRKRKGEDRDLFLGEQMCTDKKIVSGRYVNLTAELEPINQAATQNCDVSLTHNMLK